MFVMSVMEFKTKILPAFVHEIQVFFFPADSWVPIIVRNICTKTSNKYC